MAKHSVHSFASRVVRFTTSFQRARGLMFRKKEDAAYVFVFPNERKIAIHMLFVFFPIDVVWIDAKGNVIDIKKRVKPFTPTVFHRGKAQYLIELPAGTVSEHQIALMDTIEF